MKLHFLVFIALFVLTACEKTEAGQTVQSEQENFRIVEIAGGLDHPWALAFLPGGDYLVTERRGKILHISSTGNKTEITGMPAVYHHGQGGLLDIALAPDFKKTDFIYFTYAAADPQDNDKANTELARARLDLGQKRLRDVEMLFKAVPKVEGNNHWGSRILFIPDGTLLMTLGERFDYKEEAQNLANHLGTIVRLTAEGKAAPGNPYMRDHGKQPEIYTYGNRNVQGIAVHPETGKIWFHEHGPKGGDEVNILKAGANYGWPAVTFGISYWGMKISDKTSAPGMEAPVLQWTPSIAPSGMVFYSGDQFPAWRNDLFVGALAHKHLRRLEVDGDKITAEEILLKDMNKRIRDVRTSPDGYLYILTDENNGQLLRLEPEEI